MLLPFALLFKSGRRCSKYEMCVWQDVRETLQLKIYTGRESVPTEWCCLSSWACTRSKGFHNGDLHGWFTAAHAHEEWSRMQHEDLECVSRQPGLSMEQTSSGAPSGWVIYQIFFFFFFVQHWCFYVENKSLCYVKEQPLIQISRRNVLVNIPHTNALPWSPRRDGHSARINHAGEQLPLVAGPVISVGLLWAPRDVDWKRRGRRWLLGNCHTTQISNRDTVSFSLSKNHSCLCYANTLSTFVWSTASQRLLLAEGWFLDSDIKADWSAFSCQRKWTMLFFPFFFLLENDLGKHSKLFRLTQHQSERDKEAKEENKRYSSVVVVDGASQHVDVAERQSVGIVSHVLPPWAPEWQLRQENMSLLPQLLARTAMGKCQSETSAFCVEC